LEIMKTHVNLLPWSYRRSRLLRRRLRQWSVVWAVIGLLMAAGWLEERSRWLAALEETENEEARYDEVRALRGEIARLTAQQKSLGEQQDLVTRLQQAPPPLLPLALVSASAARCGGRVAVRRLFYDEQSPNATAAAAPVAAADPTAAQPIAKAAKAVERKPAQLTLEGVGADNVAVAEFVLGLRESRAFERVDLKSTAASVTRSGNVTTYQVECGL
jgi:Tfp pilus assembly protein PilN